MFLTSEQAANYQWYFVAVLLACSLLPFCLSFAGKVVGRGFGTVLIATAVIVNAYLFSANAEDAYISYRYAEHLANGEGVVWNPGEYVQGYSNFLWMVFLAFVYRLLPFEIPTVGRWACLVLAVFSGLQVRRLFVERGFRPELGLAAAICFATFCGIGTYALSGMETPLFQLLLISYSIEVLRSRENTRAAGAAIAATALVRPEGILLLFVHPLLVLFPRCGKAKLVDTFKFCLTVSLPIAIYYVWCKTYYGYYLPNTTEAKKSPFLEDALYFGALNNWYFAIASGFVVVLAVTLLWYLTCLSSLKDRLLTKDTSSIDWTTVWHCIVILGSFLAFYTYAGGDWMPSWRYQSHIYYAALLLAAAFLKPLALGKLRLDLPVFAGLIALNIGISLWHPNTLARVRPWTKGTELYAQMGLSLGKAFAGTNVLIASLAAGAEPFYAKLRYLDMVGLCDEYLGRYAPKARINHHLGQAHLAHDENYVYSRKPDIIIGAFGGIGYLSLNSDYIKTTYVDAEGKVGIEPYVRKESFRPLARLARKRGIKFAKAENQNF